MDGRWTFNNKDYGFWPHEDFATKEEAIKAARDYWGNEAYVYVGQIEVVALPTYVDVDSIFEQLNDTYAENCSEYDDFLFTDVKTEDHQWLEAKLRDLIQEFYEKAGIKSTQFVIENMERVLAQ